MKKIALALAFFFLATAPTLAAPHLVINFAQMNELNWAAPEEQWQMEVKPKIEEQVQGMRYQLLGARNQDLKPNTQNLTPILGWSTLMEYMNYPMDTPGPNAPYVIKAKRILEIARDLNFPVFIPLNGFQWWDQLPELYNWWDPDGTHTDPAFFARQPNPTEFKSRFIAGYNPFNTKNVLWQDAYTPMKLNYRNWGGGGFRLAPPPNLQSPTYLSVQHARLQAIVQEIQKDKNDALFLGLTIGTEISENASVLPRDEFRSYGGTDKIEIVQKYLEDNARLLAKLGIPKTKIYTHVLGEQERSDPHFSGIAEAAFNLYSQPGTSLYGFADNPLRSSVWKKVLATNGKPDWGAVEYTSSPTVSGLVRTLQSANLVDIYNWDGISSPAVSAIKTVLASTMPNNKCQITNEITHTQTGIVARLGNPEIETQNLPHGIYTKFIETDCADGRKQYSQPESFYVPFVYPKDTTPAWVQWILQQKIFNF